MHEIEKWIEDLYKKVFALDRESVTKFIQRELKASPMEKPHNAMNVIAGVIEFNSMYEDIYLLERIDYERELREEEVR